MKARGIPTAVHYPVPLHLQPAFANLGLAAGSYTGTVYDATGRRTSTVTAALSRASSAPVSAWAVVNGRPHWLVAAGVWAGTWLPAEPRITLAP